MVFGFFSKKRKNRAIVVDIFSAITKLARAPHYYETLGVPDTVMGRFEMMCVHVGFLLRRNEKASGAMRDLTQNLLGVFFEDINLSIRELGIGDGGVPKRMKKLSAMFYGRMKYYGEAIEQNDEALLAEALSRNLYPNDLTKSPDMIPLSKDIIAMQKCYNDLNDEDILVGVVNITPIK